MSPSDIYLSGVGDTFQLMANLTDTKGVALVDQPTFTWASDLESIVTVTQSGLLTATAFGETSIQVTSGDYVSSVSVTISDEI